MKYIKSYEAKRLRKFEEGDLVKFKSSNSQIFIVKFWDPVWLEYKIFDTITKRNSRVRSEKLRLATPEEIEQYNFEQNVNKYNL